MPTHRLTARVRDSRGNTTEREVFLTVTDPIPPPAGDCLSRPGPVRVPAPLILSGPDLPTIFLNSGLAAGTKIDARGFLRDGTYRLLIRVGNAPDLCWTGGLVRGTFALMETWDRMHDAYTITLDNAPRILVDKLRSHHTGDGFSINAGCDGFVVRGSHISMSRDDALQNDFGCSGTIEDCLFDGTYCGYSSRPHKEVPDNSGKVVTMRNTLIRLQDMPTSFVNSPGHGRFWKMDNSAQVGYVDHPRDPKLSLIGNIFALDSPAVCCGDYMILPPERCTEVRDNIMVWMGTGPFPGPGKGPNTGPIPPGWTVTTDRSVWDNARAQWLANHPEVAQEFPFP